MSYLLGISHAEIRRLEFQEKVWGGVTQHLFDRLNVRSPWRCLDVGAGIGCVSLPLARRVLPRGKVVALELSPAYASILKHRTQVQKARNVKIINSSIKNFRWEGPKFDLIFLRWILLFIHDIEGALRLFLPHLKPGGFLAIEDYDDYSAMALYPNDKAFPAVIEGAKRWFYKNGGGLDVAGRVPPIFNKLGLKTVDFRPNIQAGNGRSQVFKWQWLFFGKFIGSMVKAGGMTRRDEQAYRRQHQWAHDNPNAWFVSPIIFDVVGQKKK